MAVSTSSCGGRPWTVWNVVRALPSWDEHAVDLHGSRARSACLQLATRCARPRPESSPRRASARRGRLAGGRPRSRCRGRLTTSGVAPGRARSGTRRPPMGAVCRTAVGGERGAGVVERLLQVRTRSRRSRCRVQPVTVTGPDENRLAVDDERCIDDTARRARPAHVAGPRPRAGRRSARTLASACRLRGQSSCPASAR